MTAPLIAVVNQSSVIPDTDAEACVAALQHQVSYHFAPHWNSGAHLAYYPASAAATVPTSAWQLVILDTSDQAGALGYHDLTAAGLPLGKVFAADDQKYGYNWTVTTSHELLEMIGDPNIDRLVQVSSTAFYAYEAADACEADQYGYPINGIQVSDFVLPTWFDAASTATRHDYKGYITRPLQLLPGGYIGEYVCGHGWTQKTAETGPTPPASRRIHLRRQKQTTGLQRSEQ